MSNESNNTFCNTPNVISVFFSLAIELDLKLISDEKKGRKVALSQGVSIVGVLGIFIENYRQYFISFDDAHYYFELVKKNGLKVDTKLEDE